MEDPDEAYANSAFIPGGETYPARWAAEAAALRAALPPQVLRYGAGPRHWLDLFRPDGTPRGLLAFLHGGYWMDFGPRDWSHLARGALARGWAVAIPAYTLAPVARISAMVPEVCRALVRAAQEVAGPIAVTGHSAGGHLTARLCCENSPLPADVAVRMVRAVPISPLSDLRPLLATAMNGTLRLDPAEAEAESPALLARRPGPEVTVWVGGDERPAFLDQARWLAEAWACPLRIDGGRHHFNVIDDLSQPASALVEALLGGV